MTENERISPTLPTTKEETLNSLYQIENVNNIIYPLTNKLANMQVAKEQNQDTYIDQQSLYKTYVITTVIMIVLTVISVILTLSVGSLFGLGVLIFLFATIKSIFDVTKSKKAIATAENNLNYLTTQINDIMPKLVCEMHRNRETIRLQETMCPKECKDPNYLRLYISYFETGRADSLKEARAIFDEHLHRERMEQMVSNQLRATIAAYEAAERAANAAAAVQHTAEHANTIANQTAFDVNVMKYKQ